MLKPLHLEMPVLECFAKLVGRFKGRSVLRYIQRILNGALLNSMASP